MIPPSGGTKNKHPPHFSFWRWRFSYQLQRNTLEMKNVYILIRILFLYETRKGIPLYQEENGTQLLCTCLGLQSKNVICKYASLRQIVSVELFLPYCMHGSQNKTDHEIRLLLLKDLFHWATISDAYCQVKWVRCPVHIYNRYKQVRSRECRSTIKPREISNVTEE